MRSHRRRPGVRGSLVQRGWRASSAWACVGDLAPPRPGRAEGRGRPRSLRMTLSSEVVSEGTERAPLSQPSVLSPVPGAYRSEGWETLPELSPDPPAASGPDGSAATRSAAVEQLGRGLPPLPFCAGSPRQSLGRTAVAAPGQDRRPAPQDAQTGPLAAHHGHPQGVRLGHCVGTRAPLGNGFPQPHRRHLMPMVKGRCCNASSPNKPGVPSRPTG